MTPLLFAGLLALASAGDEAVTFSDGNAALAPGRVTMGVLSPARVGLADGLEVVAHPWLMPVAPNIAVRVTRPFDERFHAAVELGLHTPTFLLAFVAREGAGGLLPPNTDVPLIVAAEPGGSISYRIASWLWLSSGGHLCFAFGADPTLPIIELPFVLPRMAPYVGGWGAKAELAAGGEVVWGLGWRTAVEGFAGPVSGARWALEPSAAIHWTPSSWVRLHLGTRAFIGDVPYGVYVSPMWPFVDVEMGFDIGRGPS